MARISEKKIKGKSDELELIPSLEPRLGRVYSNFAWISHSPWDFTIRFCDAPPGGDAARLRQGTKLTVPSVVDVVVPVEVLPSLISALQTNYEEFLKAYRKVTDEKKNRSKAGS